MADRGVDLFVLLDEVRQADERLAHPLTEHHECKQAADQIAGRIFQRHVGADHHCAERHQPFDGGRQRLRPVRHARKRKTPLCRLRDAFVPKRSALGLQGKRFHRLDSDDGLGHRRGLRALGDRDLHKQMP